MSTTLVLENVPAGVGRSDVLEALSVAESDVLEVTVDSGNGTCVLMFSNELVAD
jgi:hypothetical protein